MAALFALLELTRTFLGKFFPPSKTASLRNQITNFTQRNDETLYEAWELFKDLLRLCPYGFQRWMIVQPFYNGVTQPVRSTINAAAGGTLMNKTKDETYYLIEAITLNNFQLSNERGQPKQVEGKLEIDALTLRYAKVDAMTQRLERLNVNVVNSSTPLPLYEICGSIDHLTNNYQVGSPFAQNTSDQSQLYE